MYGELCRDKAYLLGLMAADGHLKIEADGDTKVIVACGGDPGDREFAGYVAGLFKVLYPDLAERETYAPVRGHSSKSRPRIQWYTMVYRKRVAMDLLSHGPLGCHEWRVPKIVWRSREWLGAWLSGFADGDGHMDYQPKKGKREIRLATVNQQGMAQVAAALESFGMEVKYHLNTSERTRHGDQRKDADHRYLCHRRDLELFREHIGFRHPVKHAKLNEALASYKRAPMLRRSESEGLLRRVLSMRTQGLGFAEIAEKIESTENGYDQVRGLIKRAVKKAQGKCVLCLKKKAVHGVPKVIRGRQAKYVCQLCYDSLTGSVAQ